MWGTWWAWDPRLTSFFVLFLFYLGYIALWEAVDDPDTRRRPHRAPLPRRLGLRAAVALRRLLLEPGAAPGPVAVARRRRRTSTTPSGGRSSLSIAGFVLLFVALVLLAHPHRDPRPPAARARGGGGARMIPDLGRYAATVLAAYGVTARRCSRGLVAVSLWRAARVRRRLAVARSPEGRPWPLAATGCCVLPPLVFLAFAAVAWLGLRRENAGRAAERARRPARPRRSPRPARSATTRSPTDADLARARRQARQLLRQLVRPLPRRAPAPDGARRGGHPGHRHQLQGRARGGARLPRRSTATPSPASAPTTAAAPASTGASTACPRPSSSTATARSCCATPAR